MAAATDGAVAGFGSSKAPRSRSNDSSGRGTAGAAADAATTACSGAAGGGKTRSCAVGKSTGNDSDIIGKSAPGAGTMAFTGSPFASDSAAALTGAALNALDCWA